VSAAPATFAYASAPSVRASRTVAAWLFFCCAMIFAMVVIGGVTRLTESGLSITEWQPVTGAIPPLTEEAWQEAFAKYQQIPEYRERNAGMTLAEFKTIYWWEFVHRLWGRLIGVVYAVPLLWFVLRGQVRGPLAWRLGGIFVLGGLQGVLGWYMVQSGLVDRVDVSQYRLTAHLGLALLIYAATLWTALDLLRPSRAATPFGRAALAFSALAFLTMLAGGFVAGLDAGMTYNTFPLMDGRLVPAGYLDETPWWLNFFENVAAVQFNHRLLGIATLAGAIALALAGRRAAPRARKLVLATAAMAVLQVALGIATLLLVVPIPLAAAHQAGAVALLTFALATAHAARVSTLTPRAAA
jgi:cytochrome c oxidase assembly protein subunit 15